MLRSIVVNLPPATDFRCCAVGLPVAVARQQSIIDFTSTNLCDLLRPILFSLTEKQHSLRGRYIDSGIRVYYRTVTVYKSRTIYTMSKICAFLAERNYVMFG